MELGKKIEIGTIVVLALSMLSLAYRFGDISARTTVLSDRTTILESSEPLKAAKDAALAEIKSSALLSAEVQDSLRGKPGRDAVTAPIGSIVAWPASPPAFSSSTPQEGDWLYHWHPCDGSEVAFHEDLWTVLRGRYGNVDAVAVERIKLPDFRGHFLRAVDDPDGEGGRPPAGIDFDGARRVVGSIQSDSVGPHEHSISKGRLVDSPSSQKGTMNMLKVEFNTGSQNDRDFEGGIMGPDKSETRPKNIAVNWIIRYR